MSTAVRGWLFLLLTLLGMYGAYTGWKVYHAMSPSPPVILHPAGDEQPNPLIGDPVEAFQLIDQQGQPFQSRQLDGQVWVASFFFSSCPGACLKMNNTIARLQEEIDDPRVRFVSITVDPENDTPEELEKYARHFAADPDRWLFLTGPEEELRRVAMKEFLVAYGRGTHSEKFFVVGPDQKIAGMYSCLEDAQLVLMKRKLAEKLKEIDEVVVEEARI